MRLLEAQKAKVFAVAYSPDGRTLASAGADKVIRLWDVASGKERAALRGHPGNIYALAFSPDAQLLASAGANKSLRLWGLPGAKAVHKFIGHSALVTALAFSPDGKTLVSGSGNVSLSHSGGEAIVWKLPAGYLDSIPLTPRGGVLAAEFSLDGTRVALGTGENTVVLLHPDKPFLQATLEQNVRVRSLAFTPDGKTLATVAGKNLHLWDLDAGKKRTILKGHTNTTFALAFTRDGQRLVSAGWDETVRYWSPVTGEQLAVFECKIGKLFGLAVSPDGMTAAVAGEKGVMVWDVEMA